MTRTITLTLFFIGWLAAVGAQAESTVESIISSMSERMAAVDSLQLESVMRITFAESEEAEEVEQVSRLFFRRPDRVFIDSEAVVLFSDADVITMAFTHFGHAIQQPLTGGLQEMFTASEDLFSTMMLPDMAALLSADPAIRLRAAIEEFDVTVLPDEEYEGRPTWVVRIDPGDAEINIADGVRVWIDQDTGLIAGLQATVDLSSEPDFPPMADMPTGYDIHYNVRVVALNEPLDDDVFTYDLDGYTLVESMEELMKAFQAGSGAARSETLAVGTTAPDFELELMDESVFRLSDYRGRVVLVDFWATWCPPCIQSLPYLQSLYEELSGEEIEFVGVSLDRPSARTQVQAMIERFALTYPVGMNQDGDIATDYGATSIPTLVVIDREGVVQHVKVGFSEPAMMQVRDRIRALLDEPE